MDTRGEAVVGGEMSRGKKYNVSLLMMMSVIPFVGAAFQVAQTFQWNLRVSNKSFPKPEEYFSCVNETSKHSIKHDRNTCCHMDTESLMTLNVLYENDGHETRGYQYFHTVFGLSGIIIVFGLILLLSNQMVDPNQIASLTCYLFLGWISHISNCILFFMSVTSLVPKNPVISYFCGTSEFGDKSSFHRNNFKSTLLVHCLNEMGICPNYGAINVYLYIMFGELLLYLPVSIAVRYLTKTPEEMRQILVALRAGGHEENGQVPLFEPIRRERTLVQNYLNLNPSKLDK